MDLLNDWLEAMELLWNCCAGRCGNKVSVILLVKELSQQISMVYIYIPVLVPTLGLISRHIITEDINET